MSDKNEQADLEDLFRDDEGTDESVEKEAKAKKLKEVGVKIFWTIALAALIGYIVYYNSTKKSEPKSVVSEQNIKEVALKEELVQKHSAVIFDEADFSFSKDVQEKVGNSFLLEGSVYDIFRKNGKVFVKLDGYDYFGIFEISEEQERYIREQKNEYGSIYGLFAVVRLSDISKSLFDVETENDGEDIWTYREPSDDFLLRGELLDVKGLTNN
jgi:hypothetical protein